MGNPWPFHPNALSFSNFNFGCRSHADTLRLGRCSPASAMYNVNLLLPGRV